MNRHRACMLIALTLTVSARRRPRGPPATSAGSMSLRRRASMPYRVYVPKTWDGRRRCQSS